MATAALLRDDSAGDLEAGGVAAGGARFEEAAALARLGEARFTLIFVYYERPSQRSRLIARLRVALPERRLAAVSLQDPRLDVRERSGRFFRNLETLAGETSGGDSYDAVLLLDWEQLLLMDPSHDPMGKGSFLGVFNRGRHLLAECFACPFFVFLPREALNVLQLRAPDFVSWQAGSFFFPFGKAEIQAGLEAALCAGPPGDPERATEAAQSLASCVADWVELPTPSDGEPWVPRALARLGEIYLEDLGDPRQAELCFERLEHWSCAHGRPDHGGGEWAVRARQGRDRARRRRTAETPAEDPTSLWTVFRGATALTEEVFGRESDLDRLLEMTLRPAFRCGTLWGEAGSGKTSLIRAGLVPRLRRLGHFPVIVDNYGDREAGLCRELARAAGIELADSTLETVVGKIEDDRGLKERKRKVVLICDQLERAFQPPASASRAARETLLSALAACVNNTRLPFCCLLVVPADRLYHLFELERLLPLSRPLETGNHYELGWLRQADAVRVLTRLRDAAGVPWPEELLATVVEDLTRDGRVRPVELQLVAVALRLRGIRTSNAYEDAGRREGLLKDYLDAILDDLPRPLLARKILRSLVSSSSPPIRRQLAAAEITRQVKGRPEDVGDVLDALRERNVVSEVADVGPPSYELVHDVLCEPAQQSTSPQEIGLSVLRSSLHGRRRRLRWADCWRALRSDLRELPQPQRQAARKLLWFSGLSFFGQALFLAGLLVAALQLSTVHLHLESGPPQALTVRRGVPTLGFLPGALGNAVLLDTGLTDSDVPSEQRNILLGSRFRTWEGAAGRGVRQFHAHLAPEIGARRLYQLGDRSGGLRLLLDLVSARYVPSEELWAQDRLRKQSYSAIEVLQELHELGSRQLVAETLAFLDQGDAGLRRAAAEVLGRIGTGHEERVLPPILARLREEDAGVRLSAVEALGRLGAGSPEAVTALLPLLEEEDADVYQAAIKALERLGPGQAPEVVPKLLPSLEHRSFEIRIAAAEALRELGAAGQEAIVVERLLPLLDYAYHVVRLAALKTLGHLVAGQLDSVVPRILPLLESRIPEERSAAGWALIRMEVDADLIPRILPLTEHREPGVRETSVGVLARIGEHLHGSAVPPVLRCLKDEDANVRESAVRALSRIETDRIDSAWAHLLPLLEDENPFVGDLAASTLARIGMRRPETMPQVLQLLYDRTCCPPRSSVEKVFLEMEASERAEVLPQLLVVLRDRHSGVRQAAATAAGWIGTVDKPAAVRALLPLLEDPETDVRRAAVEALGRLAPDPATTVLDRILPLLEDPEDPVKTATLTALQDLGAVRQTAVVPPIHPLLESSNPQVRQSAIRCLRALGAADAATISKLVSLLDDPSEYVRVSAVGVLGELGGQLAEAELERFVPLFEERPRVHQPALFAVGEIAAAGSDAAVARLTPLLRQERLRDTAMAVFLKISQARPLPESAIAPLTESLNSPEIRASAIEILASHTLQAARESEDAPVFKVLLKELASTGAKLDGRRRESIVRALALWYNTGRATGEVSPTIPEEAPGGARAADEHRAFRDELDRLRHARHPWWLRLAAGDVLISAHRLRKG